MKNKNTEKKNIFKEFLPFLIIWSIAIFMYILNIIIVSIKGANLFSNLCGWVVCISLVLVIILLEYSLIRKSYYYRKQINKLFDDNIKLMLDNIELRTNLEEKEDEK